MDQRRPVPEPQRSRLLDVVRRMRELPAERDKAITDALLAGGSIREVAKLVGMSHSQVLNIGHANGWPTKQFKAERERKRREIAEQLERVESLQSKVEVVDAVSKYIGIDEEDGP